MGQGQDKIASSLIDLQPTAIVELFQLYFNQVDKPNDAVFFHGGAIFQNSITWQSKPYIPIPVESEGFEVTANGQLPRPKIRISNKDYKMTQLLLNNNDFQFGKLIRKRTFVKYLDDVNFDGGNPWGQADSSAELSNDTFVIGQKTAENKVFVEFELTSPLDLENFEVNARLLMSRYCSWYYRGNGCNYAGPPLETEYGQEIQINSKSRNNWANLSSSPFSGEWITGRVYESGDPVYLENKKIIINPVFENKNNQSIPEYAKIWYVAQTNHTSTSSTQPDNNETYWTRDGCNKKLNGCKKRFQPSEIQVLPSNSYSVSGYFIDLSHKQLYNSNNISSQASITGSSVISGSAFRNIADGLTGDAGGQKKTLDTGLAWISTGIADPWIQLEWDSPKTINRIDIYDRYDTSVDFNIANIKYYSGATLLTSQNININDAGLRTTTGFANKTVTKIVISGSGSDTNAGLAEVAVFEPSGLGLYNDSFKTSGIYASEDLHMATWVQFPSGVSRSDQLLNIFHNVKPNNQYSGINLYVSGNDNLVLNFATVLVSGNVPQYIVTPRTITMPWDATSLKALHLEIYGGKVSGTSSITSFPNGEIKLSDEDNLESRYTLAVRNTGEKISGEFFLFKNPSYTGGMTDLFFAINNWQFSTGDVATPVPNNSNITSNIKLTSNLKLGSTAIWTGKSGIDYRKKFFNRDTINIWNEDKEKTSPRNYDELTGDNRILKTGLFAWWDMNLTDTPTYKVEASNNTAQIIYLSGQYVNSIEFYDQNAFISKEAYIPQTPKNYLPFGGFPGTDRYGR